MSFERFLIRFDFIRPTVFFDPDFPKGLGQFPSQKEEKRPDACDNQYDQSQSWIEHLNALLRGNREQDHDDGNECSNVYACPKPFSVMAEYPADNPRKQRNAK